MIQYAVTVAYASCICQHEIARESIHKMATYAKEDIPSYELKNNRSSEKLLDDD
jgi:hypothetical protein